MSRVSQARVSRRGFAGLAVGSTLLLAACSGGFSPGELISNFSSTPPAAPGTTIGAGQVKVGLILPLSASGNAGVAAQSMRNGAEMALAEFNNPNIQLLVKDDGGSASGAQQAAQQALAEGDEIILGPLFAQAVTPVGQVARSRGVPASLTSATEAPPANRASSFGRAAPALWS